MCSRCGATAGVEPAEGFAQIDERYTTGHCIVCTPWPRPKKEPLARGGMVQPPRRTVQLVRADGWKPETVAERRKRERRAKLAHEWERGTVKPHNLDEAKAAVEHSLGEKVGR